MTVNNQTIEVTYTGDGNQTDFPVTFEIIDPLQVKWTPYEGSVVEAEPNSGNWVVRFPGPPTGEVRIYRDTPITQETQYNPYDAFPAEAHERALDKLTQITQELSANKLDNSTVDAGYLNLSGDTMLEGNTGIDMNGGKITGLADAVDPTDAVSKAYMEANAVAGPPGPEGPEADLTGYATETYVDDADIIAIGIANDYTDSAIEGISSGISLDNQSPWTHGQYNALNVFTPDDGLSLIDGTRYMLDPREAGLHVNPVWRISPPEGSTVSMDVQDPTGFDGMKATVILDGGSDYEFSSSPYWDIGETISPEDDAYLNFVSNNNVWCQTTSSTSSESSVWKTTLSSPVSLPIVTTKELPNSHIDVEVDGTYLLIGTIKDIGSNDAGSKRTSLRILNKTAGVAHETSSYAAAVSGYRGNYVSHCANWITSLSAGDQVCLTVWQDNSANVTYNAPAAHLTIIRIGE